MSGSVKNIFNKPEIITGVGEIHSVLMKDYDEFMDISNILTYNYEHFNIESIKKELNVDEEIKLLDLLSIYLSHSDQENKAFKNLARLFTMVLHKEIHYETNEYIGLYFTSKDKKTVIDRSNYDQVRKIIMKQNVIIEPPIIKNDIVREWVEAAINARAKNSVDIRMEDMITTVAYNSGKHYWDLENYSIYQLKSEFQRIVKDKTYHTNVQFKCAGSDKVGNEHYAENTDMYKSPYDDIIKNKNLNNMV